MKHEILRGASPARVLAKGRLRALWGLALLLWMAAAVIAGTNARPEAWADHQRLLREMTALAPPQPYLVIDTHDNRVVVRTTAEVLRVIPCATGSGRHLEGPKAWHRWDFHTPRGRFSILRKVEDPLWIRPVWDFVETGEEIPIFAEDARRFERGVLGERALYFLQDFMIHGTLYEINLGKSITHGCVRVGSADLRYLYATVQLGWAVYVY